MPSAIVVEPRMSAKRREISTSAPPGYLFVYSIQSRQKCGLLFEGPLPISPKSGAQRLRNGALQNLQRLVPGIKEKRRRCRPMIGCVPVNQARHCSSAVNLGDMATSLRLAPALKTAQVLSSKEACCFPSGMPLNLNQILRSAHPAPSAIKAV